jgi:hypothetical protein
MLDDVSGQALIQINLVDLSDECRAATRPRQILRAD